MRFPALPVLLAPILILVSAALGVYHFHATHAQVAPAVFRLIDARQQGTFNIGGALSTVSRSSAPPSGTGAMELRYMVPPGTGAGVWARAFDEALNAKTADVVRIRVLPGEPERLPRLAVVLELKGTKGVQRLPLELQAGWTIMERRLDWQPDRPAAGRRPGGGPER